MRFFTVRGGTGRAPAFFPCAPYSNTCSRRVCRTHLPHSATFCGLRHLNGAASRLFSLRSEDALQTVVVELLSGIVAALSSSRAATTISGQ